MTSHSIRDNKLHPTTSHYNLDVEFFRSFLDPYLKYTSGLFDAGHMDSDSAAVNMLDYLIDCASLGRDNRILEVGSGWGSLLRRLDETLSCAYVGISPSKEQNEFIRREIRDVPLHEAAFEDMDLQGLGQFEAVFLVGSFCHLDDKVQQLIRLREILAPGGRIVIEDSFFMSEDLYKRHARDPRTEFLQKTVFGYAEIPSLARFSDMVRQSGLKITLLRDTTDDYKRTIATWISRLGIVGRAHQDLTDSFKSYLNIAQAGWNHTTSNYVAVLEHLPLRGGKMP